MLVLGSGDASGILKGSLFHLAAAICPCLQIYKRRISSLMVTIHDVLAGASPMILLDEDRNFSVVLCDAAELILTRHIKGWTPIILRYKINVNALQYCVRILELRKSTGPQRKY